MTTNPVFFYRKPDYVVRPRKILTCSTYSGRSRFNKNICKGSTLSVFGSMRKEQEGLIPRSPSKFLNHNSWRNMKRPIIKKYQCSWKASSHVLWEKRKERNTKFLEAFVCFFSPKKQRKTISWKFGKYHIVFMQYLQWCSFFFL